MQSVGIFLIVVRQPKGRFTMVTGNEASGMQAQSQLLLQEFRFELRLKPLAFPIHIPTNEGFIKLGT